MKKRLPLICALTLFCMMSVFAKRKPSPEVEPMVVNGYEYSTYLKGGVGSSTACVRIKSLDTGDVVKVVEIYKNVYDVILETDVQDVFIEKMELIDSDTIRLTNERNEVYELDLKTYKVKKVKSVKYKSSKADRGIYIVGNEYNFFSSEREVIVLVKNAYEYLQNHASEDKRYLEILSCKNNYIVQVFVKAESENPSVILSFISKSFGFTYEDYETKDVSKMILDGGTGVWRIEYDSVEKGFVRLEINEET